jgi:hypothetical protein
VLIASADQRFAAIPLFLAGVFFILAAPLYWLATELPQGAGVARGPESAGLYQRVYPGVDYAVARLRGGELPLWNPYLGCGMPFHVQPEHGLWQPLNLVFLLAGARQGLALHAFVCLAMAGLGFAVFVRSTGMGYLAGLVGGVAFACSGIFSAGMSRPEIAGTLAWAPWFFAALRAWLREGRPGMAALAGLCGAMMLLAGAWLVAGALLLLAKVYAACLLLFLPVPAQGPRRGAWWIPAVALGVSAVQWLPSLAWLARLEHPWLSLAQVDLAVVLPQGMREMLAQLLSPEAAALPRAAYVGMATLLLLPAALMHRTLRVESGFFLLAALLLLPIAVLGRSLWSGLFPFEVLFFSAAFALAVLAALGMDALLARRLQHARSPYFWIAPAAVLGGALGLFYASHTLGRGLSAVLFLALLPVIFAPNRWTRPLTALLVAVVLLVDLSRANVNRYAHPFTDAEEVYARHADMLRAAQEQALAGRVLFSAGPQQQDIGPHLAMIGRLHAVETPREGRTREEAAWWRAVFPSNEGASEEATRLLSLMSVRVLLAAKDAPLADGKIGDHVRWRPARTSPSLTLYVNDEALPRAYWVPRWRFAPDAAAAIAAVTAEGFDPRRECIVSGGSIEDLARIVPDLPAGTAPTTDAECTLREESPERIRLTVNAPAPGILILSDTYAPAWRATLDGAPVPIHRVNGLFRGVAVPAGAHEVVMRLMPWDLFLGAGIVAVVGLVGLVAATYLRLRRVRQD